MFRPKELRLYNIAVQRDDAYTLLSNLGQSYDVNLVDMQPNVPQMNREYFGQLRRCEDILQKLNEISNIIHAYGYPISKCPNYAAFIENRQVTFDYVGTMEDNISHRLSFLQGQQHNVLHVIDKRNKLFEQKAVILCANELISRAAGFMETEQGRIEFSNEGFRISRIERSRKLMADFRLNCIAGCINTADLDKFNRLIFRTTKQNAFMKAQHITEELIQGRIMDKNVQCDRSVFIVIYSSGMHDLLRRKLLKVCEVFNTTLYDLPNGIEHYHKMLNQLNVEIEQLNDVVLTTQNEIQQSLTYFTDIHCNDVIDIMPFQQVYANGHCSYIEQVKLNINIEMATYYHLNYFSTTNKMLIGQMWCQPETMKNIYTLQSVVPFQIYDDQEGDQFEPPSLIKTNAVTWPFQELVNTYGLPRYGEINPGLFTIITFPFLFGIMFGDIGHGSLLFVFGIYLIFRGEQLMINAKQQHRSEPQECRDYESLYSVRYLIALMGLFAAYCGFIYNDYFSLSLDYANSCIVMGDTGHYIPGCTPIFGFDGAWNPSKDILSIMNSFKMKSAIVIGVTHMLFGILLKGWNTLYQRRYLDFIFDFIPQLLFMSATFGYMSILILIKWSTHYEDPSKAPSIITTLLTMAFTVGGISGEPMYTNQVGIQKILVTIAAITPLFMLYPKPLIKIIRHSLKSRVEHMEFIDEQDHHHEEVKIDKPYGFKKESKEISEEKHYSAAEVSIEAAIETIEFVLGAVSNTASYLRLWALSLAHSQLSEVFFDMTLGPQLKSGSLLGLAASFIIFAAVTIMVLMCMDSLECFLHALRLHWVEFQNKFYKADGLAYQSYNYAAILSSGIEFNSRI